MSALRLDITLDDEHVRKLARLAARTQVDESTLARWLLTAAIEDVDSGADNVVAVLDGIDVAWQRAQIGSRQARAHDTIALDDL